MQWLKLQGKVRLRQGRARVTTSKTIFLTKYYEKPLKKSCIKHYRNCKIKKSFAEAIATKFLSNFNLPPAILKTCTPRRFLYYNRFQKIWLIDTSKFRTCKTLLHEKKNKAVFRNAVQVKWVPSFAPYNDYKTMKPLLKKIKYCIFSTVPLDFFSQIVAPRVRNIFPSAELFSSTWATSNALHPISFF